MGITDGPQCETVLRIWPNMTVNDDPAGRTDVVVHQDRPADVHPLYFLARSHDLRLILAWNMPHDTRVRCLPNIRWLIAADDLSLDEAEAWVAEFGVRIPRRRGEH